MIWFLRLRGGGAAPTAELSASVPPDTAVHSLSGLQGTQQQAQVFLRKVVSVT